MVYRLEGEIIPNDYAWVYEFFGVPYFAPLSLQNALKEADPEDRELILEINSPGGYVMAGFEVYTELQKMQAAGWHVEAHVIALAASAATTIMSACDTVLCSPVGQIMVHLPSCVTGGDRYDHEDSIAFLDSIEESILNGYERKSAGRATRDELRAAMEAETWMPAQRAMELGLVDGILGDAPDMMLTVMDLSALAGQVVNSLQAGFGQTYEDLLARYEAGVSSGALEADPNHPVMKLSDYAEKAASEPAPGWQARARLELERQRYPT